MRSGLESGLGNAKTSMTAPEFLDTNVLVYAYDPSDPTKQKVAQDLVRRAVAGEILISSQVLAEFATTLLHKLSPAASPPRSPRFVGRAGAHQDRSSGRGKWFDVRSRCAHLMGCIFTMG